MSLGEALAAEAAKQILILFGCALIVGSVLGALVYFFIAGVQP